jgi:carbonic anhydrase
MAYTRQIQPDLTPEQAFQILKEGNQRFVSNLRYNRNLLQQVNETSDSQFPFAIILSCIDSRTSAELIFDQGLGDIFSVRVAGNVLNEDVLGSMEFACHVAQARLIVVLGHTRCGAVKGACNHLQLGHLTGLLNKIQPAVYEVGRQARGPEDSEAFMEAVAEENMRQQRRAILERSPIIEHLFDKGEVGIVGGMYSVETGEVRFVDEQFRSRPTAEAAPATAAPVTGAPTTR